MLLINVPFADSFGLVRTSFRGLLVSPLCSQLRPSVRRRCFGGRRKRRGKEEWARRRARVVLRWVGLHAKENRQPARMSGSEQAQQSSVKAETESTPQAVASSSSSCRKKKSESTTFFGDVLDHIDEFVHASMDEHKSCLKKTLNKVMSAVCLSVCVCVCVCVCVSCNFRDCNFFACGRAGAEGFILWFLQTLLSSVFLCCFAFFFFFFFRFQISDDVFFFIIVFFFSLVVIADFLSLIVVWMWCLSSYSLIVCGGESCMYFGPVTKENLCTIVASARRGKDCSSSKFPLTCNNLFLIFYVGKNCLWQQAWFDNISWK
jgi:hypothetical protein